MTDDSKLSAFHSRLARMEGLYGGMEIRLNDLESLCQKQQSLLALILNMTSTSYGQWESNQAAQLYGIARSESSSDPTKPESTQA